MSYKNLSIYIKSLFGYLIIGLFFPILWIQGIYLRKVVLRLPTPIDDPFGVIEGKKGSLEILGIGESPMAGVGISKHLETLTGLTALGLNNLMGRKVNWRVLAQNGLTINSLNNLIREETPNDVDLIIVSIGGNDVFNITPPWVWEKHLYRCINYFVSDGNHPLILFSPVPCVGRFPAIPNPLRLAFGYWELLLQKSLSHVTNSTEGAYLLGERFPDGEEYFLEDGVHPSKLAYKLWSEKLVSTSIEIIQQRNTHK